MKPKISCLIFLIAFLGWQCSKEDQADLTLKESLEQSSAKINSAFATITQSSGYQLLSITEDAAKSDFSDGFSDSIDLKLIAGIYDFRPSLQMHNNFYFPFRLFEKTGTSEDLIINMPEKLAYHPRHLHFCNPVDSVLKDDFSIIAHDYHFYYTKWNNADYKLSADFELNKKDVGSIDMYSTWRSVKAGNFSKKFTFPEEYTVIKSGETGDTSKLVFALIDDTDTLLSETLLFIGEGFQRKERHYILSIGNVDIKRSTGIDSVQVYLDGVLQKVAGVKIEDDGDYNSSICHKRDILLTFDDGTTAKLSELISPSMEILKSVSKAMEEFYFSRHIVDYIAFNIYYNKN